MDEKKRPRRSSILKRRSRSVSPKKSPPAMSKIRSSRRISFSERNAVREFAINDNKDTIWVASYEEPTERIDFNLLKQAINPVPAPIIKRNPLQPINIDQMATVAKTSSTQSRLKDLEAEFLNSSVVAAKPSNAQARINDLEAEFLNSSIAGSALQHRASVINYTAIESKSMDISTDAAQLSFLLPNYSSDSKIINSTILDVTQLGKHFEDPLSPIEAITKENATVPIDLPLKNAMQRTQLDCEDISLDVSIAMETDMPPPKLPPHSQPRTKPMQILQTQQPQPINESDMDISNIAAPSEVNNENVVKENESVHSEQSIEVTANIVRNSNQTLASIKSPARKMQRQSLSRMLLEKSVHQEFAQKTNQTQSKTILQEIDMQNSSIESLGQQRKMSRNDTMDSFLTHERQCQHSPEDTIHYNKTINETLFDTKAKPIDSHQVNPSQQMVSMANMIAIPASKPAAIKLFQNKKIVSQMEENVVPSKSIDIDAVVGDQMMDLDESLNAAQSAVPRGTETIPARRQTVYQNISIDISDVEEAAAGHIMTETINQCNTNIAGINRCQPIIDSPSKRFTILNDVSMNETLTNVKNNVIATGENKKSINMNTRPITHTILDSDNMDESNFQLSTATELRHRKTLYANESIDETLKRNESKDSKNSSTIFLQQIVALNESYNVSLDITRKQKTSIDSFSNQWPVNDFVSTSLEPLPNLQRTIIGSDAIDESAIDSGADVLMKPSATVSKRMTTYSGGDMDETMQPEQKFGRTTSNLEQIIVKCTGAVAKNRLTIQQNEDMDESVTNPIVPEQNPSGPITAAELENRLTTIFGGGKMDMSLSPRMPIAQAMDNLVPKSVAGTTRSTILSDEIMDVSAGNAEQSGAALLSMPMMGAVKRVTTFQNEPMDQTIQPAIEIPSANKQVQAKSTGAIPKVRSTIYQTQNMDESLIGRCAYNVRRPILPTDPLIMFASKPMDESIHNVNRHTKIIPKSRQTIHEHENMDESTGANVSPLKSIDAVLKSLTTKVRPTLCKQQHIDQSFNSFELPSTPSRTINAKRSTVFNEEPMDQSIIDNQPQDRSTLQQSPKIDETFSALSLAFDVSSHASSEASGNQFLPLERKRRRETIYPHLSLVETDADEDHDNDPTKQQRSEDDSSVNDVSLFRRKFVDMTTINMDETENLAETKMSLVTSTDNYESDESKATFNLNETTFNDQQCDDVAAAIKSLHVNNRTMGSGAKAITNRKPIRSITLKSISTTKQFNELRKNHRKLDEKNRSDCLAEIKANQRELDSVRLPMDETAAVLKPAAASKKTQTMDESFAPIRTLRDGIDEMNKELMEYDKFTQQMKNVAFPEAVALEAFHNCITAYNRLDLVAAELAVAHDEDVLSQNVPDPGIIFLIDNLIKMWEEEDRQELEIERENRPPGAFFPQCQEFFFMIRNKLLGLEPWIFPSDEYFYFYQGTLYVTHRIIESIMLIVRFNPKTVRENWDLYDSVRFTSVYIRPNDAVPASYPAHKELIAREIFRSIPKDLELLFPSTNELGRLYDYVDGEILKVYDDVEVVLEALYTIKYGIGLMEMHQMADNIKIPYFEICIMDRPTLTIQKLLINLSDFYSTGPNQVKTLPAQLFKPAVHLLQPGIEFLVELITDPHRYIDIVPDPNW